MILASSSLIILTFPSYFLTINGHFFPAPTSFQRGLAILENCLMLNSPVNLRTSPTVFGLQSLSLVTTTVFLGSMVCPEWLTILPKKHTSRGKRLHLLGFSLTPCFRNCLNTVRKFSTCFSNVLLYTMTSSR